MILRTEIDDWSVFENWGLLLNVGGFLIIRVGLDHQG